MRLKKKKLSFLLMTSTFYRESSLMYTKYLKVYYVHNFKNIYTKSVLVINYETLNVSQVNQHQVRPSQNFFCSCWWNGKRILFPLPKSNALIQQLYLKILVRKNSFFFFLQFKTHRVRCCTDHICTVQHWSLLSHTWVQINNMWRWSLQRVS